MEVDRVPIEVTLVSDELSNSKLEDSELKQLLKRWPVMLTGRGGIYIENHRSEVYQHAGCSEEEDVIATAEPDYGRLVGLPCPAGGTASRAARYGSTGLRLFTW